MIPYIPYRHHDGTWFALLVNDEEIGRPDGSGFDSLDELEEAMASIAEHLGKCFSGAK